MAGADLHRSVPRTQEPAVACAEGQARRHHQVFEAAHARGDQNYSAEEIVSIVVYTNTIK